MKIRDQLTFVVLLALLVSVGVILSGCASIPKESAMLSSELAGRISQSKAKHLGLIQEYERLGKQRIAEKMHFAIIPRAIRNAAETKVESTGQNFYEMLEGEKGRMDKALLVQEFLEDVGLKIEKLRNEELAQLDEIVRALRQCTQAYYARSELIINTLSSNLSAVLKDRELRDKVLKALNVPTELNIPKGITDKIEKYIK